MTYIYELYLNFPKEDIPSKVYPVSLNCLRTENWQKIIIDEFMEFIGVVEDELVDSDLKDMRKY